jgi:hypothetical protein
MASLGSKSQSVEIAGPIFDSVCAALNNVMQPVKRTIETITDDGVVSTSRLAFIKPGSTNIKSL